MPFFESGLDLALAARMRTLPAPRRVRPSGLKVVLAVPASRTTSARRYCGSVITHPGTLCLAPELVANSQIWVPRMLSSETSSPSLIESQVGSTGVADLTKLRPRARDAVSLRIRDLPRQMWRLSATVDAEPAAEKEDEDHDD